MKRCETNLRRLGAPGGNRRDPSPRIPGRRGLGPDAIGSGAHGPGLVLRAPRLRFLGWVAVLAFLAVLSTPTPGEAQTSSSSMTGIELTGSVQLALQRLSEKSVEWHQAFLAKDQAAADTVIDELTETAEGLGMRRLPDHCLAVLVRAVQAAEDGDFGRAEWALQAAERLDPERPETAFARATIERLQGSFLSAVTSYLRGYLRLIGLPQERSIWLSNVALWGLYTLTIAGAIFIVLSIAFRGGGVVGGLVGLIRRILPPSIALTLAGVLILGLVLLPYGLLWVLLLSSVLLWVQGTWTEKLVLTAIWLLLGVAPILMELHRQRVDQTLSPPMRAVNSLAEGRLYGSLFSDLGVLRAVLPESPAVRHLVADLHRRLEQWQTARTLYRELLDIEPENASAQVNLGVYYFYQENFGSAARFFQKAAISDPDNAAAYFNLSRAYTSSYLYEDSARALGKAQDLDSESVSLWIQEGERRQVAEVDGGFRRIPEIREELRAGAASEEQAPSWRVDLFRRGLSLFMALGLLLTAVALRVVSRSGRIPEAPMDLDSNDSPGDLLLRVFIPGLRSIRRGNGILAYLALLPLVGLLLLPFVRVWGYRVPWGYEPGDQLGLVLAALGLVSYLLLRLLQQRRLED